MKLHYSIWVVKRLCGMHTDTVHGCFDNPERLNNSDLPSGHDPRVCDLAYRLRLGTIHG
jgi:hypothetical protein